MVITFKGTTIATNAVGSNQLIGWSWNPSVFTGGGIDKKAPLGTGYWTLPDGVEAIDHSLTLQVKVASVAAFRTILEQLATIARGSLVIPVYGTYNNCRLSTISPFQITATDDGKFIVETSVVFIQYPILGGSS